MVLACDACPLVKLDDKYYKLVDKLEALVKAPPSLRAAHSLTVNGPVRFVEGTTLEGDVLVVNGAPAAVVALSHLVFARVGGD